MSDNVIQVPTVWVGLEDETISMANLFTVQLSGPEEIVLSLGQVAPPILIGTPEEQKAQAQTVSFLQARTLARVGLTTQRVRELADVLQAVLKGHETTFGGGEK